MNTFLRRLLYFLHRSRHENDLREEIETHRALRQAALERVGLSPDDAALASRRAMGNITLTVEDAREMWVMRVIDEAWQDIRISLRMLRKSTGFAVAAIGTFALTLGANTAIFSVVYAALLKPLPYPNPQELVAISMSVPTLQNRFPSLAVRPIDFEEFRRSNEVFAELAAIRDRNFNLTGSGEPERLYGARVSANLFSLLGVQPALGRTFLKDEDTSGREKVIVISHDLWNRRFGGDPGIINRTVSLDGQPHVVVGVMPEDFLFPSGKQLHPQIELGPRIDVWRPAAFSQGEMQEELVGFSWGMFGRLKAGTLPEAARANLDVIARGLGERMRSKMPSLNDFELFSQITPMRDIYVGRARQGLLMVLAAVGLLLVIGCVNLVNLLLARLTSRSRELATRAALGAPRSRLVRQLLTESMVVAVVGGIAGLPIAAWSMRILVLFGSSELAAVQTSWLNASVLLFALAMVLAAGLAVGLFPAIEMARGRLYEDINDGSRGMTTGPKSGRVRRALVMSQMALCTALLIVAGLLVRSFVNLLRVDRGFEVEHVLSLDLALESARYGGNERVAFYRELLDSIRALPGVTSAGGISVLPLTSGAEGNTFLIYLDSDTEARLDRPIAHSRAVTPGYFTAMGIPLAAGRFLEAEEPASQVIVSEALARRLWPDTPLASVVGNRIKINEVTDNPATIVGVVGDVRAAGLDRDPAPALYVPHTRNRAGAMTMVLRTNQNPEALAGAVRAEVWRRDNSIPVERMKTMREIMSASMAPRRFQTGLVLIFALVALGLAQLGVYGVTSYAVTRQTREIGVRFALGAQQREVVETILSHHLRPVATGLLLGMALAWAATTAMRSFLFGVAPLDPLVSGTVCIALATTALMACYVPARRASRIDPVIALRRE